MNIQDILDKSTNIASSLDDICELNSRIDDIFLNQFFDKDKYSESAKELTKLTKTLLSKFMILKEISKKYMVAVATQNKLFDQLYSDIISRRDAKNNISGENHAASITLVGSSEGLQEYLSVTFPDDIIPVGFGPDSVVINGKKIEECGSVYTLLNEDMDIMTNDTKRLTYLNCKTYFDFCESVVAKWVPALTNINGIISNSDTIAAVTDSVPYSITDKIADIVSDVSSKTGMIKAEAQSYKYAFLAVNKIMAAINNNFDIILAAISRYTSADSLI